MQKIIIKGTNDSEILVGEDFSFLKKYLPKKNVIIIKDDNINRLYSYKFPSFPVIKIGLGEGIKTLQTVYSIIDSLIDLHADRHTFLVGIGGGIVCDITGFVASIYMRGIDFGFVSTSLLSQIDASVGGKNGVNFNGYKNIIGNFNQASFVICDIKMLETLPLNELRSGMAELIKHALIADLAMFKTISEKSDQILKLDADLMGKLIYENIKIKASIVEIDEKEKSERKKLNFGHTLAHAIEKHSNLLHGEAVAIGIVFASKISKLMGRISDAELKIIIETIENFGLPTTTSVLPNQLAEAIDIDKKRNGDSISLILLDGIGKGNIENIKIDKLKTLIYDLC